LSAIGKNLMFWMVAALVIFLFWSVSSRIQKNERALAFSDFMTRLEQGQVARVEITGTGAGSQIAGELTSGQAFRTFAPPQFQNLVDAMLEKGVEVRARDANSSSWVGHLISWTPIVIMIAFLIFFMRQMQSPRSGLSPTARRELRLELKTRFLRVLSTAEGDLSESELLSRMAEGGGVVPEGLEAQKALYEMLSEGTLSMTDGRKYRLRTTS
jgi:cell division protease FtsH